jgi:hypothetical protein
LEREKEDEEGLIILPKVLYGWGISFVGFDELDR